MFGERLKLARKRAGLSLRDLAAKLENQVTAQALGKYENNQMFPSSGVLVSLGNVLDVDLDYLTSSQISELRGVEFRKNANSKVKDLARVEAAVIDNVERYLAIEAILELQSEVHSLANFHSDKADVFERAEDLASMVRNAWELGTDPIPGVTRLLEAKGLKVLALEMPDNFSGLTCEVVRAGGLPSLPVIVVSNSFTIERRRFTLCHEMAHRLLGKLQDNREEEKVMHRFASAFLMPKSSIIAEFGEFRHALAYEEILRVKHFFGVSAAALIVRLKDLGIIREGYMTYLFQTAARTWRSSEPDALRPQEGSARAEEPERFERLVYRALAEQLISLPKGAALLKKSMHDVQIATRGPLISDANSSQ